MGVNLSRNFPSKFRAASQEVYESENLEDQTMKVLVQAFFDYMREVWIESNEQHWYEASHPYASGNNQGIEGLKKEMKQSHTFRKLMALGSFFSSEQPEPEDRRV